MYTCRNLQDVVCLQNVLSIIEVKSKPVLECSNKIERFVSYTQFPGNPQARRIKQGNRFLYYFSVYVNLFKERFFNYSPDIFGKRVQRYIKK